MANWAAIDEALDHIEHHPENFDMRDWAATERDEEGHVCGTTFCLAGHAVLLAGGRYDQLSGFHDAAGRRVRPDHCARQLLGLTPRQADEIFLHTSAQDATELREHIKLVLDNFR